MRQNVKEFIENNIDVIRKRNWKDLYTMAKSVIPFQIGNLTYNLRLCGIDPLKDIEQIYPEMFSNSIIDKISIPENINVISRDAFLDCFQLKEVRIPKTVVRVHDSAFKGCYELNDIFYQGTKQEFLNSFLAKSVIWADCKTDTIQCLDGFIHIYFDGTITVD